MDAITFFLGDHARVHSHGVGGAEGNAFIEDAVLGGLTDEQLRARPGEGLNSIGWLVWHLARTEDMAVNLVIAGRKQVLEDDGWLERLGLTRQDIGTGMSDDEVTEFTQQADMQAIRDYRVAVGKRTREVVQSMRPEQLDEIVDTAHIDRAFSEGSIDERAQWLRGFVGGKTKAFVLGHSCSGHGYMHIGEIMCLRSMMGTRLPV
jgi:hypothetical protein